MNARQMKLNILIVDDEKDLRLTIKEVFEIFGWQVDDAENGNRGLEFISKKKYDLIISDIRMPKTTGIDLLNQLPDAVKRETPIFMMSAYSDYSEADVQSLGARKLIAKPISVHDLLREIESLYLIQAA